MIHPDETNVRDQETETSLDITVDLPHLDVVMDPQKDETNADLEPGPDQGLVIPERPLRTPPDPDPERGTTDQVRLMITDILPIGPIFDLPMRTELVIEAHHLDLDNGHLSRLNRVIPILDQDQL